MVTRDRPVKVAVVGTGLAGLSTAYMLSHCKASDASGRPLRVEVHLFDRSESIGMDTASLSIKSDDESFRVDVPMRSINGGSHGRVRKLYQHLGVPLVRSDFSYSFSRLSWSSPSSTLPPRTTPEESQREDESIPPTPPPAYAEPADTSRPVTPVLDAKLAAHLRPPRPSQSTSLLYSGASGLRWPPISLPSHLDAALFRARIAYLAETALLAASYLYLLALAFFYVSLGLARPASTIPRTRLAPTRTERFVHWLGFENVAAVPLATFCAAHYVPQRMVTEVVIPLMAAVATVGVDQAREMPTGEVLDYIVDTFAHSHYVTDPSVGVRGIVRRLVAPVPLSQIHLGIEITRLEAVADGDAAYRIHYRNEADGSERPALHVDHVVFATQADQAARLLSTLESRSTMTQEATAAIQETVEALRAFTYVRTLVVTHRDESVLPVNRQDRRDLNLAVFDSDSRGVLQMERRNDSTDWDESLGHLPPTSVQTTHIIAAPSASSPSPTATRPVLQTTNPLVPIDPDHVLSSTWFSRAFVTAGSQAVLGQFLLPPLYPTPSPSSSSTSSTSTSPSTSTSSSSPSSLQGRALGHSAASASPAAGGVWFVGSYIATGFPLLEGCVSSAEGVVRALVQNERATLFAADPSSPWPF
ncbi:hypothetical protein JCM3774_003771 [Rhodotorula dairenensis]